jgi:hypothetical protein
MGCDGQAALRQCFYQSTGFQVNATHYDIIGEVRKEIKQSCLRWEMKYIPGHQTIFPLDREATLNEEMDIKCKEFWEISQGQEAVWFNNEWNVWIQQSKITSNLTATIRSHCSIIRAEKYWTKKIGNKIDDVDWEGTKVAMKGIKQHRQQWITKHISGFCSVGRMAKRVGLRDTDKCPRCQQEETAEHVWTCQHVEVTHIWEERMEELKRILGQMLTPTPIISAVVDGLTGWRNGVDVQYNSRTTAGHLGIEQTTLGWKHFFEGRLHYQWRRQMEEYYTTIRERKTGKRWVSALIRKLWEIAWDLWEHRNGILHDKTQGYANLSLTARINELWRHPLLKAIPSIKHLVKEGEESIQRQTHQQKQQWVIRVEAAIRRYETMRESTVYHQEREGMRQYLNQFRK